jgi:phosphoesterase RecJ-like protein
MAVTKAKLKLFHDKISKAQTILITTHEYPDADGIGSQIGLCLTMRTLGKNVVCVNEEELLDRYKYLDPENVIIGHESYKSMGLSGVDLIIIVDTNNTQRIGKKMQGLVKEREGEILFVDHHPCSDIDPKVHLIDTKAAATGELASEIIKSLGVPLTKQIALPLYTAIIIDTSSFRYPNVTGNTHKVIAELMETGINPPQAYNGIYGTKKIRHMHVLGSVLQTTNCNSREDVAWIILDMDKITKKGTDVEDTHAFINHLLILENIKIACMFRDDGDKVKISFRSSGNIDVGYVAKLLKGGGHSHSAATMIPKDGKTLSQIIEESVTKIEVAIDTLAKSAKF